MVRFITLISSLVGGIWSFFFRSRANLSTTTIEVTRTSEDKPFETLVALDNERGILVTASLLKPVAFLELSISRPIAINMFNGELVVFALSWMVVSFVDSSVKFFSSKQVKS